MARLETQSEMKPSLETGERERDAVYQTDRMMQCLVGAVDSVCGSFVHTIG